MKRIRIDSDGISATMNGEAKMTVDFHAKRTHQVRIAVARVPSDTVPEGAFHTLDLENEGGVIQLFLSEIQLEEIAEQIADRKPL